MGNIIIVDFRDNEDFERYPYISYLKQTLNMICYIEETPQLWKLDDFFIACVSDYLRIKKERVAFTTLWDISIDHSSNVGIITKEKFYPIIKKG